MTYDASSKGYDETLKKTGYDFQSLKTTLGSSGVRKGGVDARAVSPKAQLYQQQFKQAFSKN